MLLGSCRLGGLSPAHLPEVSSAPSFLSPKPTDLHCIHSSLQACRALEVSSSSQVLVPREAKESVTRIFKGGGQCRDNPPPARGKIFGLPKRCLAQLPR